MDTCHFFYIAHKDTCRFFPHHLDVGRFDHLLGQKQQGVEELSDFFLNYFWQSSFSVGPVGFRGNFKFELCPFLSNVTVCFMQKDLEWIHESKVWSLFLGGQNHKLNIYFIFQCSLQFDLEENLYFNLLKRLHYHTLGRVFWITHTRSKCILIALKQLQMNVCSFKPTKQYNGFKFTNKVLYRNLMKQSSVCWQLCIKC